MFFCTPLGGFSSFFLHIWVFPCSLALVFLYGAPGNREVLRVLMGLSDCMDRILNTLAPVFCFWFASEWWFRAGVPALSKVFTLYITYSIHISYMESKWPLILSEYRPDPLAPVFCLTTVSQCVDSLPAQFSPSSRVDISSQALNLNDKGLLVLSSDAQVSRIGWASANMGMTKTRPRTRSFKS